MVNHNKLASWAYLGAVLDMDFANNRYTGGTVFGGTQNSASNRMLSVAGETNQGGGSATVKAYFAPDANGLYHGFNQYVLRKTLGRGIWVEGNNTNYTRNCRNLTAASWTISNSTDITVTNTGIPGADGGHANSATVSAGGSGYSVGDRIYLVGGAVFKVATLSGSAVATVSLVDRGSYLTIPSNPIAQFASSGSGTGATLTVTWQNAASRLTAAAGNGTIIDVQTLSSNDYVGSALIKRVTGTGTIEMTIDNGSTWTDITNQLNSSTFTKVEVPYQAAFTATGIGFRMGTISDVIDVDFVQLENCADGVFTASNPILTTGSSVARGSEAVRFNHASAGDGYNEGWKILKEYLHGKCFSYLIELEGNGSQSSTPSLFTSDVSFFCLGGVDGGAVTLKNGNTGTVTTTSSNTGTYGMGNRNGIAFGLEGGQAVVMVNGIVTVDATNHVSTDAAVSTSHFSIGNRGAGDKPINGVVKRATVFPKPGPYALMNFVTRTAS